jgi:lipoprotein NlpI
MSFARWLLLTFVAASSALGADDLMRQISRKITEGKREEAMEMFDKAVAEHPTESKWLLHRGRLHALMNQNEKAIEDFNRGINIDTNTARLFHERGMTHFRMGHIKEAVADFDHFVQMLPAQEPEHWQRGIALYYAGEYERGRKQFELHQKVNPYDVENAVWHFLCVARAHGVKHAKASLIQIERDPRVPMKEIFALFAGKGRPEDVLTAARQRDEFFYAHLYLGLYYEAHGDEAKAREHIDKAAGEFSMNHYMGDVARVHAKLLKKAP